MTQSSFVVDWGRLGASGSVTAHILRAWINPKWLGLREQKGEETRETEEKNEGKWDSIKFGQIRPNLKTLKILHVELSEEC